MHKFAAQKINRQKSLGHSAEFMLRGFPELICHLAAAFIGCGESTM